MSGYIFGVMSIALSLWALWRVRTVHHAATTLQRYSELRERLTRAANPHHPYLSEHHAVTLHAMRRVAASGGTIGEVFAVMGGTYAGCSSVEEMPVEVVASLIREVSE